MLILEGYAASPGIAIGPVQFLRTRAAKPTMQTALDTAAETRRALAAVQQVQTHLNGLAALAGKNSRRDISHIVASALGLLAVADFTDNILAIIEGERLNASYAAYATCRQFAAIATAKTGMAWKRADAELISHFLLNMLGGHILPQPLTLQRPTVLVADELCALQLAALDKSNLLGILLQGGGPDCPAAILARTQNLPCITGLGQSLPDVPGGTLAIADGHSGNAIFAPTEALIESYTARRQQLAQEKQHLAALRNEPTITRDGVPVTLSANIGHPDELPLVLENGAEGIGLLRSEHLYMKAAHSADEETQYETYRLALATLAPRRVVVRALDIGDGRQPFSFPVPQQDNQALGYRGIRFCLENPEIFRPQIRALLRASVHGKLGIALPFVTHPDELRETNRLLAEVKEQLLREGIPFSPQIEYGIVVETPAAVMMADKLAPMLDFFTIDIDSLAMYTFVASKANPTLRSLPDSQSHAVLRMAYRTALYARQHGIRAGICGESAADATLLPYFLGIGVDEIILPPHSILKTREDACRLHAAECRRLVGEALA